MWSERVQSLEVRGVVSDEGGSEPYNRTPPPLFAPEVPIKPETLQEERIFFRQKPKLALSTLKDFYSKMEKSRRPGDRAKSPGH